MSGEQDHATVRTRDLVARVERLVTSAELRWELFAEAQRAVGLDADEPVSPAAMRGPRERARELRDHARSFLLPRARDLDAPLLIVILGPTGSGKSSLLNTLAGAPVSRTGVLRPTTRDAIAVGATPDLERAVEGGALAELPAGRLERHPVDHLPGLVVVDAPDVDSVEREDRALADHLLEAADLGIFVTTATRYADRVPWEVLQRAEQRHLDLVVVINRMPQGTDANVVREDLTRLLSGTTLAVREILAVPEGALAAGGSSLARSAVEPLIQRLVALSSDGAGRRALAADALAGALDGVTPLAHGVADDLAQEARQATALLDHARRIYAEEAGVMLDRLFSGSLLREEVIRHWHSFVGADQVTRLFSSGIGRVRGTIAAVLRRAPVAPVATVQEGAADDIAALVVTHAAEAARRTSERWSADPRGAELVTAHPQLWSSQAGLAAATRLAVDEWVVSIAADVAERGTQRRGTARLAALGVNAVAVTLMLLTFTATGGLTGAEAGIAAATAFLNQKLLNALFGEAAVQEMVRRARRRLSDALEALLAAERQRFDERVGDVATRERLAGELRSAAGRADG